MAKSGFYYEAREVAIVSFLTFAFCMSAFIGGWVEEVNGWAQQLSKLRKLISFSWNMFL